MLSNENEKRVRGLVKETIIPAAFEDFDEEDPRVVLERLVEVLKEEIARCR